MLSKELVEALYRDNCFYGGRTLGGYSCSKVGREIKRCPQNCAGFEPVKKDSYRRRNGT